MARLMRIMVLLAPLGLMASCFLPTGDESQASADTTGVAAARTPVLKAVAADTGYRMETADVIVDADEPDSAARLIPYVSNLEEWLPMECEQITPTRQRFRFQRIIALTESLPGASLPQAPE